MNHPAETTPVVGAFTPLVTEPPHAGTATTAALPERPMQAVR